MLEDRVSELRAGGLCCSQIVMTIAVADRYGKDIGDVIRAMAGYGYGMYAQHTCGSLLGGAGALAMCLKTPHLKSACRELSDWFEERFGGAVCRDILGCGGLPAPICEETMAETAEKCIELLEKYDAKPI